MKNSGRAVVWSLQEKHLNLIRMYPTWTAIKDTPIKHSHSQTMKMLKGWSVKHLTSICNSQLLYPSLTTISAKELFRLHSILKHSQILLNLTRLPKLRSLYSREFSANMNLNFLHLASLDRLELKITWHLGLLNLKSYAEEKRLKYLNMFANSLLWKNLNRWPTLKMWIQMP